jgi:hypothetical protein
MSRSASSGESGAPSATSFAHLAWGGRGFSLPGVDQPEPLVNHRRSHPPLPLPDPQRPPHQDELPDVIGAVIDHEQEFTQVGLVGAVRDHSEEVDTF